MEEWVKYTKLALTRYADFQGRSRRAEYWWFALASLCWVIVEEIALGILRHLPILGLLASLAALVVSLILIVPSLAVSFRRLHDTNRSAWWILIYLIPVVGFIILIVFWASAPKPEGQRYDRAAA